jgi:hypothetical protein
MLLPNLTSLTYGTLVQAAHGAARVLTYRDGAETMLGHMCDEAAKDATAKVALEILERIETQEGRPIGELSEEAAGAYVRDLSGLVEQRLREEEPALGPGEAAARLESLRSGTC